MILAISLQSSFDVVDVAAADADDDLLCVCFKTHTHTHSENSHSHTHTDRSTRAKCLKGMQSCQCAGEEGQTPVALLAMVDG